MDMNDFERMKAVLYIYSGLKAMAPEDIEQWRRVCLEECSQDEATLDFINTAANMALKPECMKK